ncbi:ABC transporter permease [Maribellus maritimus]|uniref:ABC transporter permease n=1 Tax=Maribellus maritimus TaxID=2870838 RepID=UPI001EECDB59|nr:ABC transporter permease [Maribellus maritimus]MCG6189799.1 ABC transporter permease [Maribellus maritimus]
MRSLKIISRNLFLKGKSNAYVLVSFSVAFTCALLIYLFVADEFAFDKHFSNYHQTYRLNIEASDKSNVSCNLPGVLYDQLEQIPGTEEYARLQTYMGERYITVDNETFLDDKFFFGDPEIFQIFDFNFLTGSADNAMEKPFSLILSKSTAEKYFGDSTPIGKTIRMNNHDFTVTAVIEDMPAQTHFSFKFLAPISSYRIMDNNTLTQWYVSAFNYYFLLPDNVNKSEIESRITDAFAEGNGISQEERKFKMALEPLADIHLKAPNTRWDNAIKGDIKVVYGFIVIALLIVGIAISNYVNVLTANYQDKVRENSIRKINGASGFSLIRKQLKETSFLLTLSLFVAASLVYLLLPFVNDLSGKELALNLSLVPFIGVSLSLIVAGSVVYPVLFMQSFKIAGFRKSQSVILDLKNRKQHLRVRGTLVTFQLIIATALIASSLIINKQLYLVTKTKTGFDQENTLVVVNPYGDAMNKRYNLFKQKLEAIAMVKKVGVAQNAPAGFINNYTPVWLPGGEDKLKADLGQITVDHDFLSAIGAKFIQGKNFDKNIRYDEQVGIVINESAVKALNLTNPIGQKVVVQNNAYTPNNEMEIIGVVEDMQYFTLKEASKPVMYFIRDWGKHNIVVRLDEGNYKATLQQIKNKWNEVEPGLPFTYQFMDDRISLNYASEISTAQIITILSAIAVFLSVLGILGMIVFTVRQRIKEIGIRKVNGAKISEVLVMLNKDFIKWVIIAFVIATPIAYYTMNKWLEDFAYKTNLSWWIFALAGVLALGIALLTVNWQSWRAATKNPVEALRYE